MLLAAACAPAGEDVAGSDSNVVTGVDSPNAKPDAGYLKSRRLDSLVRLNALPGDLGRLAARADGTLVPAAADGVLTLDELLALDKPENLQQLLPAERIVLPALWQLLETAKGEAAELTVPPIDVILATDISEPATTPVEPETIQVSSLKTELQRLAIKLEQLHDSDDDDRTITKADIAAALAAPAAFQPWERAQLKTIQGFFLDRAGTKLVAKVRVTEPAEPPYTLPVLQTWNANASLGLAKTIAYEEKRFMDLTTGTLTVTMVGRVSQHVKIKLPSSQQLLVIDDATGNETFFVSGVLETDAGTKTVEVWEGTRRVGSYRSKLPKLVAEETTLDLNKYADYQFINATDGKLLKYVSTEGEQTDASFRLSSAWTKDGYGYVSDVIKQGVANPAFNVPFGRYAIPTAGGNITLELYPEGILKVTRPNGWSERAIYKNNVWTLPDGSDLKLKFDPSSNTLYLRTPDETPLFQGALTGSLRTG